MTGHKICVIGGGPAGLAAALEGAASGFKVDLFERYHIGENIKCAEGFFDSLGLLGKPDKGLRYKVSEAILQVNNREYVIDCRKIRLWMIDRKEWQCSLAEKAKSSGVKIFENTKITVNTLDQLKNNYDWIIDATGVPSLTSIKYGFQNYYKKNSAVTVQYVINGDFTKYNKKIKFVFFPYYEGYYWIFPKDYSNPGHEIANVGIGWFPNKNNKKKFQASLWDELDRILRKEKIKGDIIKSYGGLIPIRLLENLQYDNILLVGDGAGCASPLHGGGIDTAYLSGQLAVKWISRNKEKNCYSFSEELQRFLAPKNKIESKLCNLWMNIDRDTLDTLVALLTRNYIKTSFFHLIRCLYILISNMKTFYHFWRGYNNGNWN